METLYAEYKKTTLRTIDPALSARVELSTFWFWNLVPGSLNRVDCQVQTSREMPSNEINASGGIDGFALR